jgi:hypothetical protein
MTTIGCLQIDDFNYLAAPTEFRVACPEPGTDAAQLLICAHMRIGIGREHDGNDGTSTFVCSDQS